MSIIYAFFAGIFVSLAANLFTGARLGEKLALPLETAYSSALFFLLSSVGLFTVSYGLEQIRNAVAKHMGEPLKGGFPDYLEGDWVKVEFRKRRAWIITSFIASIILILYSVIILITGHWSIFLKA